VLVQRRRRGVDISHVNGSHVLDEERLHLPLEIVGALGGGQHPPAEPEGRLRRLRAEAAPKHAPARERDREFVAGALGQHQCVLPFREPFR
jgi:hypothetical protein